MDLEEFKFFLQYPPRGRRAKGETTIKLVAVAPTYQITGEGWVYDSVSGAVMANCDTDADEKTVLYNTY